MVTRFKSVVGQQGMRNVNGNVMCAVACKTSGLEAGKHDLVEISIVPLKADLMPMEVLPFTTVMRPKRPQNADREFLKEERINLTKITSEGIDPFTAADALEDWFAKLQLSPKKKICVVSLDWMFDRAFVIDWLGISTFYDLFNLEHRDIFSICMYLNDRADFKVEHDPFPLKKLAGFLMTLGLPPVSSIHDTLEDALASASLYRELCKRTFA